MLKIIIIAHHLSNLIVTPKIGNKSSLPGSTNQLLYRDPQVCTIVTQRKLGAIISNGVDNIYECLF